MPFSNLSPDNKSIKDSAKSLRKVNDSLDRLNGTIVESNQKADDYNKKMKLLTWVGIGVAIIGIAVTIVGVIIAGQNLGISETQKQISENQLKIQELEFNKAPSLSVLPRRGFEVHHSGDTVGFWLWNNGRANVALDFSYYPSLLCDGQRIQGFDASVEPQEKYKRNPQWLYIDEQIFMTSLRGLEYDINSLTNYHECYIQVDINALQPATAYTYYRIKVFK